MTVTTPYTLAWDVPDHDDATVPSVQYVGRPRSDWPPPWLLPPPSSARPSPEPQRQIKELREWTGLSNRALAGVLGTSHPTIGALLSGESVDFTRKPEIRRGLANLHALCERLAPLVCFDSPRLLDVLYATDKGIRIVDIAARGSTARAYGLALREITPANSDDLPGSVFSAQPGTATVALHD